MNKFSKNRGFTLIEILVVIGIIAILATIVVVAINPARQFAQARDSQRVSNLNSILNAVGQRIADHKGLFRDPIDTTCTLAMDPTALTSWATTTIASPDGIDLRPCLVPVYISELPVDPSLGITWNGSAYNTSYSISKDPNGRMHVIASTTEPNIPRNNSIEVVR